MLKLLHYLFYGLVWIITLIPLRVLYIVSYGLYIVMYYFFPYRRKVVYENIKSAFPEKSQSEVKEIMRKFYAFFVDFIFETVKGLSIPKFVQRKRYKVQNPEVINELYDKGYNVVLVSGHYGNWEWLNSLQYYIKHQFLYAAKKLHSGFSNFMIEKIRQRWNAIGVPMEDTYRTVIRRIKNGERILIWLLADQRPPKEADYWTKFLNHDTAFFLGAAKMVKRLDMALVFADIKFIKRGFYEIRFEVMYEPPVEASIEEITTKHVSRLEQIIKERPSYWLWSHKRWKHKKPLHKKNEKA